MEEQKTSNQTPVISPVSQPTVKPSDGASSNGGRGASGYGRGGFGQRRPGGGGFGGGQRGRGRGRGGRPMEKPEYEQKTLDIARVARVTKGGKRFSFRTTIVIGNGKGRVGVGIAKGRDVAQSIQKAYNQARKSLIDVVITNGTIPYQVEAKYSSAMVLIKPSRSGIKAGGPVRVVAQLAGIRGLTGKLTGRTNNKLNIARATIEALKKLRTKAKEQSVQVKEVLNSQP